MNQSDLLLCWNEDGAIGRNKLLLENQKGGYHLFANSSY